MHGDAVAMQTATEVHSPAPGGAGNDALPEAGLPPPTLAGMWASLFRFLTPQDIDDLYLYLRDVAIASLTGSEPVEPPPELAFKMAVLQQRLRKEGDHYWRTVILPELFRLAPRLLGWGGSER